MVSNAHRGDPGAQGSGRTCLQVLQAMGAIYVDLGATIFYAPKAV